MQIRKFIILYTILLCAPNLCFANAYGIAEYEVTHVALKQELLVKVTMDVEGKTELLFPISFISSNALEAHIKDIEFSIPKSRIEYKNNKYIFYSPSKERIMISYTIKNPLNLKEAISRSPYVASEMFYFNNGFLIYPNVKLSENTQEVLFKGKIKFKLPKSYILYSSDGNIEKNQYTDLGVTIDQYNNIEIRDVFFLGGDNNFIKTSQINTNNGPMDLIFCGVKSQLISHLTESSKKIFNLEQELFNSPPKVNHIPFTAFMDNEQIQAINGGEKGENFHGSIVYNLGQDPAWYTVLAHEYIHNWMNNFGETNVTQHALNKWFFEGFTEYYAWKTMFKGSLITTKQLINRVNLFNFIARINTLWSKSYPEVASSQYLFQISYQKGFLLALELDQDIIHASKEKYSLDDVMKLLIKKLQSSTAFSTELLKKEITIVAQISFDKIFSDIEYGKYFVPTEKPFGIKRKLKYLSIYVPKYGFDLATSALSQIVTKVDKLSPAYKAGLRDGDFFPRDRNQMGAEPTPGPQVVTLIVGTADEEKTITYTTESEKIIVPQYELLE